MKPIDHGDSTTVGSNRKNDSSYDKPIGDKSLANQVRPTNSQITPIKPN